MQPGADREVGGGQGARLRNCIWSNPVAEGRLATLATASEERGAGLRVCDVDSRQTPRPRESPTALVRQNWGDLGATVSTEHFEAFKYFPN